MKRPANRTNDRLTKEESEALTRALSDGFSVYGHMTRGTALSLEGIVDEPFFGCVASSGRYETATVPDWVSKLREEGVSEEEILDEYEEYIDSLVSDEAPHWRQTNPFEFSLKQIRSFFEQQYKQFLSENNYNEIAKDLEYDPIDFIDMVIPYSKRWFEILILEEFGMFDICFDDVKNMKHMPISMPMMLSAVGKIGRLVEHYRWRFSFGQDAMRGRSSVAAARAGARARAVARAADSKATLALMKKFVDQGHSISNAALLAFKANRGTSAEANRRLWTRHQKK